MNNSVKEIDKLLHQLLIAASEFDLDKSCELVSVIRQTEDSFAIAFADALWHDDTFWYR